MPTAAQINLLKQVRVLIYGRFKTGKTEGAATFPRPNFLSFDQGMDTVASRGFAQRHPQVALNQVIYQDFYELKRDDKGLFAAHNAFDDACRYFDAYMEGKKWKSPYDGVEYECSPDMFDTWVVDSGTTLGTASMAKGVMLLGDKSFTGPNVLSNTYAAAKKAGLLVPKQQDFGAERSLLEQFIRMIYDSGKHVVLICHEKEHTNDSGGIIERVPLLTGQSVERVCLLFNEVYRLINSRQGTDFKRYVQTQPDGITKCGSRMGVPDGTAWDWDAINRAVREQAAKDSPTYTGA